MVLHPEVQSRAHAELDALLGSPLSSSEDSELHRLPTTKDRGQLPFVDAIMKEVWRWNPSVPLGEHFDFMLRDDILRRGPGES